MSNITHGMSKSPEYSSWVAMKKRCYYSKTNDYERYGGAGITVCNEWRSSFETFYNDMGPRPSLRHSLDRIDGTRGYTKNNVRWATPKEQARNRKFNPEHAKRIQVCKHCNRQFKCETYRINIVVSL